MLLPIYWLSIIPFFLSTCPYDNKTYPRSRARTISSKSGAEIISALDLAIFWNLDCLHLDGDPSLSPPSPVPLIS